VIRHGALRASTEMDEKWPLDGRSSGDFVEDRYHFMLLIPGGFRRAIFRRNAQSPDGARLTFRIHRLFEEIPSLIGLEYGKSQISSR
jgi:hypothetical protein